MANIIQRSPFPGMVSRSNPFGDIDEWFSNFGMRPFLREIEVAPQIRMDVSEDDKAYTLCAEIPGVKKEDIKVSLDGNRVSISAEVKQEQEEKEGEKVICRERYHGSSYRSFNLECEVDESKVEAKYENGTLKLTLPKKSGSTSKQIRIM